MTFNFAPWAIDGARSRAGLARLASYAASGGRSGVVQPADLRVTALAVPGQGLRVASGGASILNHYLSNPDEAYVVSNPATHTVLATNMPGPQPATTYYLVCVVVGDPEFNQAGHPFMPPGLLDPAEAAEFEYVRVVIIPCPPGTTSFEQLGYSYPGYALARLEVPPSTTTITNSMITDLRTLMTSRQETQLIVQQPVPAGAEVWFNQGEWQNYGDYAITIPRWATRMTIYGRMDSLTHFDPDVTGYIRLRVSDSSGSATAYELPDTNGGGERVSMAAHWDADISNIAGNTIGIGFQVVRASGTGWLIGYQDLLLSFDIRYSERPI